jgi:hypothetical protein
MPARSRFTWFPTKDTDPKEAEHEPPASPAPLPAAAAPPPPPLPATESAAAAAPPAPPGRLPVPRAGADWMLRLPAAFEQVEVNMTYFGEFASPSLS